MTDGRDATTPAHPGGEDAVAAQPPPVSYQAASAIQPRRCVGKVRKRWGVWGLSIVTLGIYAIYWWYKANEEVREYDERVQVQPGLAVVALFVPIASLVTLLKTGGRIGQVQRFAGLNSRCSGFVGFLLVFLLGLHVVYYQGQLNKVWAAHGNQPPGTRV